MKNIFILCFCLTNIYKLDAQLIGGLIDLKHKAAAAKREKEMTQGTIIVSHKQIPSDVTSQGNEQLVIGEKLYFKFILKEQLASYKGAETNGMRSNPYEINGDAFFVEVSFLNQYQEEKVFRFYQKSNDSLKNKTVLHYTFDDNNSNLASELDREKKEYVKMLTEVTKLKPGTHKITFKIWSWKGGVGKSEFPLAIKTIDFERKLGTKMKVGYSFENIKSMMSNEKLKTTIIDYLMEQGKVCNPKNGDKIIDLKILDKDWEINRNKYSGVVLGRLIRVAILIKNADGACMIDGQTIYFVHDGSKFQESVYEASHCWCDEIAKGPCDCK